MATASQLIAYLRGCYEADNRETGIPNILQAKYRHVAFVSGDDVVLSGLSPRVPVDQKTAERALKESRLYRRDKTLIFAALMILGPGSGAARLSKRVCAPLVFFPAEIVESNDVLVLEPRLDEPQLNFPVLSALAGDNETVEVEVLLEALPPVPWERTDVHTIAGTFAEMFPQVDFTHLASFPTLVDEEDVRRNVEQAKQLICLPACAMALIPNSPDTRGVLFELAELADQPQYSEALNALLSPTADAMRTNGEDWPRVPAILSAAQLRVLQSARQNRLTFVNGPPGTGKSYTIAAIALDHLSRNETVLIGSRMNQAVNVVADKIEDLLGCADSIVRAGRKEHMRKLKKSLQRLLGGLRPEPLRGASTAKSLRRELRRIDTNVAKTERTLYRQLQRQVTWGKLHETPSRTIIDRLMRARGIFVDWQLGSAPPLIELIDLYRQQLRQRTELVRRLLQATLKERVARLLRKRRADLSSFLRAIRARGDTKQQRLFAEVDFRVLLHAFPVWLSKLTDLANVLPPAKELFDVAIIDEATQCDIASALPLLQRAKRLVVVGDPKQLRHVSFLSDQRRQALAAEHELDDAQQERFHFRDKSILDAAEEAIAAQDNVIFLNEHFRSLPQIIRFSNEQFYDAALHVMRQRPDNEPLKSVQIRQISGKRGKNGVNQAEASALLDELLQLTSDQDGNCPQPSIGVLSPFRDQVDFLTSLINRKLSHQTIQQHDLQVGTAHTFQGEERDIMLLSLVADGASHSATFRFLNYPNVLNVSITRARHRQIVFTSFTAEDLPIGSLLRRFLDNVDTPIVFDSIHSPSDRFRDEVASGLKERGCQLWTDFPLAGLQMDLIVLLPGESTCGIDLVGHPGRYAEAYPLERYRMIERAGMRIVPLAYRDWSRSPRQCLDTITSSSSQRTLSSRYSARAST